MVVNVLNCQKTTVCLQVKCHQYWPNPDSVTSYGDFTVTCHNEEGNSAFLVREMTLVNTQVTAHTYSTEGGGQEGGGNVLISEAGQGGAKGT